MKFRSVLRSALSFLATVLVTPLIAQTISTANLGANQVTLQLTGSATGTGYFTLLSGTSTACGTAAQVKAGQTSTAAAAYRFGSLPLTGSTTGNYTVRNLAQSTAYTVCFTPDGTTAPVATNVTTTAALSGGAWSAVGAPGFTNGSGEYYTSLAIGPDGTPYVAFSDLGNSYKATVMKYTGGAWVAVGSADFSSGQAYYTSLAFSPDGTPYLAFSDGSQSYKATVMKYTGGAWVLVGSAGFAAAESDYVSLAFSPDGTPYVVSRVVSSYPYKATVMKYTNGAWATVGSAGFSAGMASYTSIAFGPDGAPYVSYVDGANSSKATVMKYTSGAWAAVGSAGFSAGAANYNSLAIGPDGTPYVAYTDAANSYKATVMKYTNGAWATVGSAGFSASAAYFTALAIGPDGSPYLGFKDSSNSNNNATVMQYTGDGWVTAGSAGFSAGAANFTSLAIGPDGSPYLGFADGGYSGNATVMKLVVNGPAALTGTATGITATTATLNGTVNDNSFATTISFDYGTTTSYGTNIAATTPTGGSIAAGTGATASAVTLTGLTPNTTYHFRADATGNNLTVHGADATFTTPAVPVVTSITPTSGAAAGGTTVTITGTGFTGATIVSFGSTAAASYTPVSDTRITAVTPAGTGTVDVIVTTPSGSSATSAADQFTYNPPITGTIATANLGANQVTLQLTSSATGTGYFTLLLGASATCGTAAQTVAGEDSNGNAAYRFGSASLTAATAANYTVRNLAQTTGYTACFTPDGAGAPVSANITTTAQATYANPAWKLTGSAGFSSYPSGYIQLAFAPNGQPYVGLQDNLTPANSGGAQYNSTVMQYNGTSWAPVGTPDFAPYSIFSALSFALAPDGTPSVVFQGAAGNGSLIRLAYMQYTSNFPGQPVAWSSNTNAPNIDVTSSSLAFGPDGSAYVAYPYSAPDQNDGKVVVMRLDGTSWGYVGSPFSVGFASNITLAFGMDGLPYVAYSDGGLNSKASVMKYNGSSWVQVGSAGFSAGASGATTLAFGADGAPYVGFVDGANNSGATVMKYNGTSWVTVGIAGFSASSISSPSLAFSPDGSPYLAYQDNGNGSRATVMKYNGTAWAPVASVGFSSTEASSPSLAFGSDGTPYVAFINGNVNQGYATVMQLGNAAPSATTGTATSITGTTATLNGTVNDNNLATTISFDYGTSTSYGTNVAATTPTGGSITAGTGSTASAVSLTGLTPGTTYHFRVNATGGGSTTNGSDATFTTTPLPVVTVISPPSGVAAGGTTVTITGTGFTGATSVSFGSTAAASYTYVSSTQITAVTPAGTGTVDTIVTTPGGASATSAADQFIYNPPATGTIATANLGANQVTLQLTSSATGTGYFTLLSGTSTACGTAAQTAAGQDSTGAAAYRFGSLPLTAATAGNYTVRNLAQATGYTVCFTPDGAGGPVTANVTTTAQATYPNAIWNAVDSTDLSANAAVTPSFAFAPDGTPYLAAMGGGNGWGATVRKYNGTTWGLVGVSGFSASTAYYPSLSFAPDGTPYVVYMDTTHNFYATVMKYNGTAWGGVGSAGFTSVAAYYPSLAFGPDGTPYLEYEGNNGNVIVMKYNGTTWVAVGPVVGTVDSSQGVASGTASFAFGRDGMPYVAYVDHSNSNKATVVKYNGTAWVTVGSAGFTAGSTTSLSLAFGPDGTPYVGYSDGANSSKATVMQYNGTAWVAVGSTGFSTGASSNESLAIGPDATPYLAYQNPGTGYFPGTWTVRKYNGSSWVPLVAANWWNDYSSDDEESGQAVSVTLAFGPDGTPYVAYQDQNSQDGGGTRSFVMQLGKIVPSATTGTASSITASGATLNGTVNDNGLATTIAFEYGTTASYGTTIASTTPANGTLAALSGATATSVGVTGLTPGTTYHFRVDATAGGSTVNGADATFTTQATPVVTFTTPSTTSVYGVPVVPSATAVFNSTTVAGTYTYTATALSGPYQGQTSSLTPQGGILPAGTYTFTANFTPTNTALYTPATGTMTLTVTQATPSITTLPVATSLTYGQTLASSVLTGGSASSNGSAVPGVFTWTAPSTAPVAGTASYSATFTPTDTVDYTTVTGMVSVLTNPAAQTITFPPLSQITYGSAVTVPLRATGGGSGNAVAFTLVSGPGTISGSTLTLTGAGTVVVAANQASSSNYSAASQVTQSVVVTKASSKLVGPSAMVRVVNGQTGSVPVSVVGQYSGSGITAPGGSVTYTITNVASVPVASGTLTIANGAVSVPVASTLAAGNYTLTLSYAGDGNYTSAASITTALQVGQITPVIVWSQPASLIYGSTLANVMSALAQDQSGAVAKAVAGTYAYTVNGSPVTSVSVLTAGAYTVNVSFTPTDAVTYKTAAGSVSLTVNKVAPALSLASSVSSLLVTNPVTLTATVSSSISTPTGSVTFLDGSTSLGSVALTNGVAALTTSSLAVGTHAITAVYAGDTNFAAQTSSANTVQVQDFNLNLSSSGSGTGAPSQTVVPGGTATFNFTLAPTGMTSFPAPVTLTVSGLPPGATGTLTPNTLPAGALATPVTLTVQLPKQTAMLRSGEKLAPLALAVLLLPFGGRIRRRAGRLTRLAAMLLLLVGGAAGVVTLTGCGSSTGFFSSPQTTYNVVITATSGTLTHSTTVTLTVQ